MNQKKPDETILPSGMTAAEEEAAHEAAMKMLEDPSTGLADRLATALAEVRAGKTIPFDEFLKRFESSKKL